MSSITQKPLVVVSGATGDQGSSVVRFLLRDGGYNVRALTRNPSSEKARALKDQGAEVVACELTNADQVNAALQGAYAVMGITDYWEHGAESEVQQGKNLADASKASGVKHFLWASLHHIPGIEPGHWESKIKVEKYLHEIGVPTTAVVTSFFFENLWKMPDIFAPKRQPDGSLILDWPAATETLFPSYAAEDLGAWVLAALKNPEGWIGKRMGTCTQMVTPRDYANAMSEVFGEQITLKEVSREKFHEIKPHVHDDLWLNIKSFLDRPDLWRDDIERCYQLYPQTQDLKKFVENHRDRILATFAPKA